MVEDQILWHSFWHKYQTHKGRVLLQTGTVSSVMAVGNTLVNISPHLTGAIDIVMVRQPDGSLKSSPFYGEAVGTSNQYGVWTSSV